uniref:Uncharacterized protein n=1 Tax=Panagrolaimus sp. ES5 TaxID=591445 RepID=A0AC34GVI1_9BILA
MFIAKKWRNYENSIICQLSGPNGEESKSKRLMSISKQNFANFRQKAKVRKELKQIQNSRRNFLEQKFS